MGFSLEGRVAHCSLSEPCPFSGSVEMLIMQLLASLSELKRMMSLIFQQALCLSDCSTQTAAEQSTRELNVLMGKKALPLVLSSRGMLSLGALCVVQDSGWSYCWCFSKSPWKGHY